MFRQQASWKSPEGGSRKRYRFAVELHYFTPLAELLFPTFTEELTAENAEPALYACAPLIVKVGQP